MGEAHMCTRMQVDRSLPYLLQGTSEAAVCDAVEAEWARETLESNSSAATLRQIITAAPPSPQYAHYYSSYLRR